MRRVAFLCLLATSLLLALDEYFPSGAVLFRSWAVRLAEAPWAAFTAVKAPTLASPGWLLVLAAAGGFASDPPPLLLLKAPAIAAVLALFALTCRRAATWSGRDGETPLALPALALACSPALVYNATEGGLYAAVTVLLGVGFLHFALVARRTWPAAACFGVLIALQPAGILMAPAVVLAAARERRGFPARLAVYLGLGALIPLAAHAALFGWGAAPRALWEALAQAPGSRGEVNLQAALGANARALGDSPLGVVGSWLVGLAVPAGPVAAFAVLRGRAPPERGEELGLCFGAAFVLTCALVLPGVPPLTVTLALPFFYFLGLRSPRLFFAFCLLTSVLLLDQVEAHRTAPFLGFWKRLGAERESWRTPVTTFSAAAKGAVVALLLERMRCLARAANVPTWPLRALPRLPRNLSAWRDAIKSLGARLTRAERILARPFPLVRRDAAKLGAALAAAGAMAFAGLGARDLPRRGLPAPQAFVLKPATDSPITALWVVKDHYATVLRVRCAAGERWQEAALPMTQGFGWTYKAFVRPCAGAFDLEFVGDPRGELMELLLLDARGRLVRDGGLCPPGGEACVPFAQTRLFDESSRLDRAPSREDGAVYDEPFNLETAFKSRDPNNPPILTTAHPFLGRALIAASMRVFGPTPWAFRLPGALAGTLLPLLLYLLARELFGSRRIAELALVLSLLDCARLSLSRLATVDSQLALWLVLGYLGLYRWTRLGVAGPPAEAAARARWTRQLALSLCGLMAAFGAAAATKWIGLFAAPTALLCGAAVFAAAWSRSADPRRLWRRAAATAGVVVALPLALYVGAYLPFLRGGLAEALAGIAGHQRRILSVHTGAIGLEFNPYQSTFLSWPLVDRPVGIFARYGLPAGEFSGNFIMANPILWWAILPAVVYGALRRETRRTAPQLFLTAGFLGQWLPWALIDRSGYLYHFFSPSLFGLLAVAAALGRDGSPLARLRGPYLALAALTFLALWPPVVGQVVPSGYFSRLPWFDGWLALYDDTDKFSPGH